MEEISGCTNVVAKGAKKQEEIRIFDFFFISFFTVSVIASIYTFESSNDFMILVISFISSFEINEVNPFPLIFLSNLFTAFEAKLLTNPGKLSLARGITIFVSAFFPKLPNQEPKGPPD